MIFQSLTFWILVAGLTAFVARWYFPTFPFDEVIILAAILFVRGFANQIADGTQALDGRALVRADLYGEAARGTFEAMRQLCATRMKGMEEEIRILCGADYCDGCLEQAALGLAADRHAGCHWRTGMLASLPL